MRLTTLHLDVATLDEALSDFSEAWKSGRGQTDARVSFPSIDALFEAVNASRWSLLHRLLGGRAQNAPELARIMGRDESSVRSDLEALAGCGVVDRSGPDAYILPYDALHVDLMLRAA